ISLNLERAIVTDLPVLPRRAPVPMRWGSLAAAVLLVLGLIFVFKNDSSPDPDIDRTSAEVGDFEGQRLFVEAEDGTRKTYTDWTRFRNKDHLKNRGPDVARVTLDAAMAQLAVQRQTRIKVDLSDRESVIILEGDGEVIASLGKQKVPFVVEVPTGNGTFRVRALGTVFGVKRLGKRIEVRVYKGSVSVEAPGRKSKTLEVGDVWANGDRIAEDIGAPKWAAIALPELVDLPEVGATEDRIPASPDRLPSVKKDPALDMDVPINGGARKKFR
ncbi:MAG: FecR domain-containing protein, partial [Planctomycetota bacterium]|nr:FecR domain-containing protein [Planctomycetota bacterium]